MSIFYLLRDECIFRPFYTTHTHTKLTGGLTHFLFFHILGRIPTDFHIFQRGRYTTNQKTYFETHPYFSFPNFSLRSPWNAGAQPQWRQPHLGDVEAWVVGKALRVRHRRKWIIFNSYAKFYLVYWWYFYGIYWYISPALNLDLNTRRGRRISEIFSNSDSGIVVVDGKLKYQLAVRGAKVQCHILPPAWQQRLCQEGTSWHSGFWVAMGSLYYEGSLGELVAEESPMVRWVFPWTKLKKPGFSTKPPLIARGDGGLLPSGYVKIAIENHHFQWVNPLFQWPFSIAILT